MASCNYNEVCYGDEHGSFMVQRFYKDQDAFGELNQIFQPEKAFKAGNKNIVL